MKARDASASKNDIRDVCSTDDFLLILLILFADLAAFADSGDFADFADSGDYADFAAFADSPDSGDFDDSAA